MKKIIFIQGIKTSPRYQKIMEEKLRNLGFSVSSFPVYFGLYDYDKMSELMKKVQNEISESQEKVVVVAHSLGGILAMSLGQICFEKIEKSVCIASPFLVTTEYMKELKVRLGYTESVKVPVYTCGFYLDRVVKKENTIYKNSVHKNFLADHGKVLFLTNFLMKKILKFAKVI